MKNLFSMHGNLARVLFDAIDIPVFIMNDRGEMLYANAACHNLLSIEDELSLDAFLNQHQDLKEGLEKVLLHEVETCSLEPVCLHLKKSGMK